ncbi:MAG: ThiF family adenylyltransferase [Gemmataceae bacterium]
MADATLSCSVNSGEPASPAWSYAEAFSRHRGLVTEEEQYKLRCSRIAVAGMGGVGGVHLMTLARLGVGNFTVADADSFDVANFSRQYGATIATLGRNKAEVMAEMVEDVNPEARVKVLPEAVSPENVGHFLQGADVVIDGIDGYAIGARRLLFHEARRRGLWAITAGPIGFSVAWLSFSPHGMSFDEYFDLNDDMDYWDQIVAFAVGMTPKATQRSYFDLATMDPESKQGRTTGLACSLCAGVATAQALKIILGRGPLRPAPWYGQFDAYQDTFRQGRLRWGNRHPLQRLRRWLVRRWLRSQLGMKSEVYRDR